MSKCLLCGKDMMDNKGVDQIGLKITYEKMLKNKRFWKKQMGKYYGMNLKFCYECWIDLLLGVKKYEG